MSGFNQNGVVPGNVIDFRFSGEEVKDKENLSNLFRDGSMVLVNPYRSEYDCWFIRYDPSKLHFMKFDPVKNCMWVTTKNPVEGMVEQGATSFFMKGSDLFYNKCTKEVFLKCEEDWYQVDFANEKHFILNNNLSITLHNIVTDQVKTLGEMRAWEVVDSDYEPFSEKWLGTPNLNSNYLDNFTGNPPFTGENSTFTSFTPGAGKTQTVLDIINSINDNSSDEEVESSEEEQEYAQDPNDVDSSDSESEKDESDADSDYDPAEDLEEGEVYEEDKVYENQFDQDWLNEYYDEKRQDIDGNWYTRRQFYDYYGSDDAWDNLDPNTFQPYRYDEVDCEWHSKEEFFQQYGSDCVWDKFHSVMVVKRTMIWRTYQWASTLPKHLRKAFIKEMIETY